MEVTTINAELFARMFLAGANNLEAKKEWINELNVFPVPDGDTGTNMSMTIMSAAKEVAAIENPTMASLAKAISSGSLRGARGNSGVILSQLFRGFTKVIAEYDELTVQILSDAFQKGTETAYKAVMKPKEGTILTVAKGMSDKAAELGEETDDLAYFCEEIIKEGDHVLSKTPDMLPVLKQAGVVDSGGQGLMQVLKGAFDALMGKEVDYKVETVSTGSSSQGTASNPYIDAQAEQEITFTYCTQFLIMLEHPFTENQETEFKSYLESIGDSIVVVADDEIVKVHVHTNDPGMAMQRGLTYGSLTTIIIENMRLERDEKISAMKEKEMQNTANAENEIRAAEENEQEVPAEEKEMGFISVSIGEGINEIFRGLGVDYIIEGGQTMNPSTEDMLNAIEKVNAKNIFILPNNKNIIMAANQAASLTEDKNIIVIPTKTIPQGITALVNYIPDSTPEDNAERMGEEIQLVKTIFEVFMETGSLSKTDQYLLEHRCVTKRGKQFTRFAIRGILTNPVYMIADETAYQYLKENNVDLFAERAEFDGEHGVMAYNRTLQRPGKANQIRPMEEWIVAVGKHPGIVAGGDWVRVQAMLDVNKSKSYRRPRSNVALLSGLLRCGECGDYMRPKLTNRRTADGELIYTYMCSTKERSHGTVCAMKNCNGNTLDAKIIEEIRKLSADKETLTRLLAQTKKVISGSKEGYDAELALLREKHTETEERIKRLVESLSVASDTSAKYVMEQIDALHQESETQQMRLAELEALTEQSRMLHQEFAFHQEMIESFASAVDSATLEEKRRLLRTIVKKVVWDGKNAYVYLFAEDGEADLPPVEQPMYPSGEDSE